MDDDFIDGGLLMNDFTVAHDFCAQEMAVFLAVVALQYLLELFGHLFRRYIDQKPQASQVDAEQGNIKGSDSARSGQKRAVAAQGYDKVAMLPQVFQSALLAGPVFDKVSASFIDKYREMSVGKKPVQRVQGFRNAGVARLADDTDGLKGGLLHCSQWRMDKTGLYKKLFYSRRTNRICRLSLDITLSFAG